MENNYANMKVYRGVKDLKGKFKYPVVAMGNFDGVHLGHREIFDRIKKKASETGGESIILTFDPHPAKVLRPEESPILITPLEEKLALFQECDIDGVILADFTKEFASQHAANFVEEMLFKSLSAKTVIVGHDFTFGKGKEGTINSLRDFGRKFGFSVEIVEAVKIKGEVVSSTKIRELIRKGEVRRAKSFLGRFYSIRGKVVKGHSRGKTLGFPTANIEFHGELSPKDGVYAVKVLTDAGYMQGIVNIGLKPTFGDEERSIEVHIFDFNEDLYNKEITVFFVDRIRGESAFKDPVELKKQIGRDIVLAKDILRREND